MGSVYYARKDDIPLAIIIPGVLVPMLIFIVVSVYCYRFDRSLEPRLLLRVLVLTRLFVL